MGRGLRRWHADQAMMMAVWMAVICQSRVFQQWWTFKDSRSSYQSQPTLKASAPHQGSGG